MIATAIIPTQDEVELVLLMAAAAVSEQESKLVAAFLAWSPNMPAYWSTSRVQEQTYG